MLAMEVAILSERGGRPYNEDACGHWHSRRHLACVLVANFPALDNTSKLMCLWAGVIEFSDAGQTNHQIP